MPKLLLVEDQPDLRKMLPRVLKSKGYEVVAAATVAEAFDNLDAALAHGGAPQMLLSDLSLPDGDGLTMAREIQRRAPEICIAFMSGYDSLQASGFDRDAVDDLPLLRKPFTLDELFTFVDGCLERNKGFATG